MFGSMMSNDTIKLFCFAVGFRSSFSVEIKGDKSVDDLKEAIWEKNKTVMKGIDALQLSLWKVNISSDKNLQDEGRAFLERARAAGSKPLDPTRQISEYFDSSYWNETPKFGTIHVLVEINAGAGESLHLFQCNG